MSAGRTLVDCTVLSLRDASVYYPCCKGCFCRIDRDVRDATRWRCSRCGYGCARDLVDYRYRLPFRVTRDQRIFGITVFGACLNPYFGIPARGLKRLVESLEGPSEAAMRSTTLTRAVEDCFIGRRFFFGIKLADPEVMPWSSPLNRAENGPVHFIASQMILPVPTGLSGCSVVAYYRRLFQKAAEFELDSADGPAGSALLLTPHQAPNQNALSPSGPARSLPRLQHQNSSPASTFPWQQSPGLVTSSAESSFEDIQRSVTGTSQIGRDHRAETRAEVVSPRSPSFVLEPYDESAPEHFGFCSAQNRALEFPPRCPPHTSAGEDFVLSESLSECVDLRHTDESNKELGSQSMKSNRWARESGALVDLTNTGRCISPPVSSDTCDVHEEDLYNCSADLFSEAPGLDTNRPTPAGRSPSGWSDKRKARPSPCPTGIRLRDVHPDTPADQTAALGSCSDFVPASQSTPIVARAAASSRRTLLPQDQLKERLDNRHLLGVQPGRMLLRASQPLSELEHPQNSPGLGSPQTKRVCSRDAQSEDVNIGSWSESSCCSGDDEACDWSRDLFSDC